MPREYNLSYHSVGFFFKNLTGVHMSVPYKNSEYDQEIPQSQTADNGTAR